MNTKAWRTIVGTLLVLLFLTKGKLSAPPPTSIGNKIEGVGVTALK